jgi:hypothetical protein
MARDESRPNRDPERKTSAAPGSKREGTQRAAAMALRRGRSGYGIESIRPHLRAQLEQRKLWRTEFPPQPGDEGDED